jgi:hypothetical protein
VADSDSESKLNPHIPFLFYDVIGRMMPGAYLLFGAMLCWFPFICWGQFVAFFMETHFLQMSGALAAVAIGAGLLLFGFVSSFVGFLLAALSHVVVEKGLCHWSPLSETGLEEFLGIRSIKFLNERFEDQFGSEPTSGSLNRSSFLCAYYIWRTNATLGGMQGRFDSDLLASQSFVLVSLALIAAVSVEIHLFGLRTYFIVWLCVLLVILLASGLSFVYHRKKRVYGRFGLFLAISDPQSGKEPGKKGQSTIHS